MAALLELAPALPGFSHWLSSLFDPVFHQISHVTQAVVNWYGQAGQAIATVLAQFSNALASAALWQSALYGIVVLVMLVGVVGAFVPALPGATLIVGAIVVWGLVKGFAGLGLALAVAIAALLLSIAIDYLSGIVSAQRVGASNWGQIGAVIGMLFGLFGLLPALPVGGPILGLICGTVLGAFIGEFLHRRELTPLKRAQQSFKVGIAIVVGNLVGTLLQGLLAVIPVIVFIVTTWPRLYGS